MIYKSGFDGYMNKPLCKNPQNINRNSMRKYEKKLISMRGPLKM